VIGIKKSYKIISLKLPKTLLERIDIKVQELDTDRSKFIRNILRKELLVNNKELETIELVLPSDTKPFEQQKNQQKKLVWENNKLV